MITNPNVKGNRLLMGSILVLIIISLITISFTFNIQNQLNALQSDYNQLANDYSNMQNELNSIQSSISRLDDTIITSSSQERIRIAIVTNVNESALTLKAESLSGVDIVVIDAIIRDSSGNIVAQNNREMPPQILPSSRRLVQLDISFPHADLSFGTSYTITLITEKGNSFTSSPFTRSNYTPTPQPQPSIP